MTDDNEFKNLLSAYQVTEDAGADAALLDRITAKAAATPQQVPAITAPAWAGSWVSQVAAMAAVALLGFWVGNGASSQNNNLVVSQANTTTNAVYLQTIIFGPNTWQEVRL